MASFESCAFSSRYYVEIGEKNISEEEAKAVYAHNRFFTSTVVNGKRTYTDINQYQSGWILTYYMFFEDACEPTLAVMQFADFLGLNIDDRAMKSLHDRIKVDFTKFTYTQLVSFPEFIQLSLINGYIGLFQSNSFNMAFKQFLEDAPSMARLVWESTNRSELLDAISTPVKRRNALVKLPFEDLQPYLRRDMGVKEQDPVLVDLLERIERARHPKELPRYINTERIAMLEHAFSERKKELQRGK